MNCISLNGMWKLSYFLEGTADVPGPDDLDAVGSETISASVPGNVEMDLQRAGKVGDPFFGRNMYSFRKYEFYQWWYQREFEMPEGFAGKRCELLFHGLDCVAEVWLNGARVGECANMLAEQSFDVTDTLRIGATNHIAVRIRSPINAARSYDYDPILTSWENREECLWIRKAAHMYGWDIAPRFVSAGIWRPVEIIAHDTDEITDLYYYTANVGSESAKVVCHFKFETAEPILDGFSLRFTGKCGDHRFERELPVEFVAGKVYIDIPDPQLWWPKGYGEPCLYEMRCDLIREEKVLSSRTGRIGVRTVHLERTEYGGEDGKFRFIVNGEPIMVKGANWVPLDAFHSRDAERVDEALELFDDLGCNMVRCWGGNVYEDHSFFNLCDERGIMVWQDFSFACAKYPQTDGFQKVVEEEGRKVIRKLRNHPSLAIWCGDNEIDGGFFSENLLPEDNRLTRDTLKRVVQSCDPHRPYIPSSPYISPEVSRNMDKEDAPEQHLWGPRDYFKSRYYLDNTASFISEIGYHGCPNVSSIKKFIPQESLWPWDNDNWRLHSVEHWRRSRRGYNRNEIMVNQVKEFFGKVPDSLEGFAPASQISQAEAKKFFIELARMRKWRCSGILWWNVIDCWPQFSDAVVDYYFAKKLAYYYIRRVQVPVCIMIGEPSAWHLPVVVGNDSRDEISGSYSIKDADSGSIVLSGDFFVEANRNLEICRIGVSRGEQKLFLIEWKTGDRKYGNHYLCGSPPFSLEIYRRWLRDIAILPQPFDAEDIAS